ncbi:UbiH/UbiF/VisC/COQ6 family ubiquinone biosynthesis hydroxylase [Moraxella macacae 0408225]|uniref:UbiH/UbiF/VisC/COQ6 family ubiquinone biosynthesis hydroxylase n=1 Tax=Moraxella macacae 0408225 TaxID=1230338 RepID=L2F7R7_9GAMM|nr:FAD-dependent monooxygenase [Moraxella macacae]ELA08960.1 UbiH/UbiF/VisC/COQ6 family ubiquinone biosynthesis hydroxylase [Moraxella macacae 0408225]
MNINNNTLVVGGGIVGASFALSLAKRQYPVTLIDVRPYLSPADWEQKLKLRDARVFALSLASIQILQQIGAWQNIQQSGRKADYCQMQVWQINGIGELKFGNNTKPNQLLGSMIEPFVIEKALYERFNDADIVPFLRVINGRKLTKIHWLGVQQGYQISLDNGDTHTCKLLIGADGRGSMVRQEAGIGLDMLDYAQTAICCAIKTAKTHNATARQVFLTDSILALLPLADTDGQDQAQPQHWQSIVWSLPTEKAKQLLALTPGELANEIAFASGYALGEISEIQSIASFALTAQHAKQYVKANLALIGDAAHGVHPLAGQGLNLGLLDVIDFINILQKDFERSGKKVWADFSTLQRYERKRYANNAMMMHSFSGLNWLFGSQFAPVQQIRNVGVHKVSKIKPLMQFFSKQASGI